MTSISGVPPNRKLLQLNNSFENRYQRDPVATFGNSFNYSNFNNQQPKVVNQYKTDNGAVVTEQVLPNGYRSVGQKNSDGTFETKVYDNSGKLKSTFQRNGNIETGQDYDSDGRVKFQSNVETEKGDITKIINAEYTSYEYNDNNTLKSTTEEINGVKTTTNFDENGGFIEKYERKGAVTTWFDNDGKPIKRETDKGQGIVETENLTE